LPDFEHVPGCAGGVTEAGATSRYTNLLTAAQQFFRLKKNLRANQVW